MAGPHLSLDQPTYDPRDFEDVGLGSIVTSPTNLPDLPPPSPSSPFPPYVPPHANAHGSHNPPIGNPSSHPSSHGPNKRSLTSLTTSASSPAIASYDSDLRTSSLHPKSLGNSPPRQTPSHPGLSRSLTAGAASRRRPITTPRRDISLQVGPPSLPRRPSITSPAHHQFRNNNINGFYETPGPSTTPTPHRPPSRGSRSRSGSTSPGAQGLRPFLAKSRSPSPDARVLTSPPLTGSRSPTASLSRRSSIRSTSSDHRKSIQDLEREVDDDDDDDDDIPDHLVLDNVPITPRPPLERSPSRSVSPNHHHSRSPNRSRDRRSVGNGTPSQAVAQGSLKSPTWKEEADKAEHKDGPSPSGSPTEKLPLSAKIRAMSWNLAMDSLSEEARQLTVKLEEREDERTQANSSSPSKRPATWSSSRRSLDSSVGAAATRASTNSVGNRSTTSVPQLPPLRKPDTSSFEILPISKEKEAVLSKTRLPWLPPKDPAEEQRHIREYMEMMAKSAEVERRREEKKAAQAARKQSLTDSLVRAWEQEVVPQWDQAVRLRKTRDLWWKGIPTRSRAVVWPKAIGNELGLTEKSYEAALQRAQELEARVKDGKAGGRPEEERCLAWFAELEEDVERHTWPDLKIFQAGGPLHGGLVSILRAFVMYRGDVGYVHGCHTIAALLLLMLPSVAQSFIALANVLNRPLPLAFYVADPGAKSSVYNVVFERVRYRSEALAHHLQRDLPLAAAFAPPPPPPPPSPSPTVSPSLAAASPPPGHTTQSPFSVTTTSPSSRVPSRAPSPSPSISSTHSSGGTKRGGAESLAHIPTNPADVEPFLAPAFTALFTGFLAIDEAARLWDVFVFEGESVLVRAAVALLLDHEQALLATRTMDEAQALLYQKRRTVADAGAEDRWMQRIRDVPR